MRRAAAGATGMSGALGFYYARCHTNKCPLPGSIHAALRFCWVNNLPHIFHVHLLWLSQGERSYFYIFGPVGSC